MSIDWSSFALPKGTPRADEKAARKRTRESQDEAQNKIVKARSGGQCEIVWELKTTAARCTNRASEVHHMRGGIGVRGRGKSLLAQCKQHVCGRCHQLITSHRLRRLGSDEPKWDDVYVRVK